MGSSYIAGCSSAAHAPCLDLQPAAYVPPLLQDIAHTFPNHRWLHEPDGQASLKRVLAAYSVHNEEVGYCRPMVHIVVLLLVALNR